MQQGNNDHRHYSTEKNSIKKIIYYEGLNDQSTN